MNHYRVFLLWLLMMACVVPSSALAQSVNYGKLERLFGEPVTTDATGSPQTVGNAPVDMQIITQDDIRRSGADNIPDILAMVPGIDVRRYGSNQVDVSVRGYDQPYSPRLLVLINGRQTYDDSYGYVQWYSLPVQLSEIRQIEVVKGPNSALFGFNAVGGVVNIVTYDPLTDTKNTATVTGGTQSTVGASAVGMAHWGDVAGLRLSAGSTRSNEFSTSNLVNLGTGSFYSRPYRNELSLDTRVKLAPETEATLEATETDARSLEIAPTFQPEYAHGDRANSVKIGLKAQSALGLLGFDAYRNKNTEEFEGGPLPYDPTIDANSNFDDVVYVVQASDLFKVGSNHSFRLGFEYRDNSASSTAFFGGRVSYNVYAGSAMWAWQIFPDFAVTNSVRLDELELGYSGTPVGIYSAADYNDKRILAFSFNSGAVFRPNEDDTYRMMVARGIQAPSLVDFGLQSLGISGSPVVGPASIMNYETDYDRQLPSWEAKLRLALYYQETADLIGAFGMPPVAGISYPANYGNSNALGGELGISGTPGNLRWDLSYAFESISNSLSVPTNNNVSYGLNYSHGTPTHTIKAGLGYSWDKVEVDSTVRWQSQFTDYGISALTHQIEPEIIGNYVTLGARAGYDITPHLTVALSGQQLARNRLLETAGPAVERQVLVSLTVRE